jgi:hypothetical protein
LVLLDYDVPVDLANTVAATSAYPITVTGRYQSGYSGSGGFTMEAWISHDHGAT